MHDGQVYGPGVPYWKHIEGVVANAEKCRDDLHAGEPAEYLAAVSYSHDTVEDFDKKQEREAEVGRRVERPDFLSDFLDEGSPLVVVLTIAAMTQPPLEHAGGDKGRQRMMYLRQIMQPGASDENGEPLMLQHFSAADRGRIQRELSLLSGDGLEVLWRRVCELALDAKLLDLSFNSDFAMKREAGWLVNDFGDEAHVIYREELKRRTSLRNVDEMTFFRDHRDEYRRMMDDVTVRAKERFVAKVEGRLEKYLTDLLVLQRGDMRIDGSRDRFRRLARSVREQHENFKFGLFAEMVVSDDGGLKEYVPTGGKDVAVNMVDIESRAGDQASVLHQSLGLAS